MPSRFVRFDPETVQLLDACVGRAREIAAQIDPQGADDVTVTRLASALVEAASHGERDADKLVDFALQVLPAYREGRFRRLVKAQPLPSSR